MVETSNEILHDFLREIKIDPDLFAGNEILSKVTDLLLKVSPNKTKDYLSNFKPLCEAISESSSIDLRSMIPRNGPAPIGLLFQKNLLEE